MAYVESQTQLFLKALLSYYFFIRKFARKTAQSYTPWNEHVSHYFCCSYELHDVEKRLLAVPAAIDTLGDTFTSVDFTPGSSLCNLSRNGATKLWNRLQGKLASVTEPLGHIRDLEQRELRRPERHD